MNVSCGKEAKEGGKKQASRLRRRKLLASLKRCLTLSHHPPKTNQHGGKRGGGVAWNLQERAVCVIDFGGEEYNEKQKTDSRSGI